MRVLIVVLALLGAAYATPRQSRIVGGEATTIEKHPFMVSMLKLQEEGVYRKTCGSTLITPVAVVSASHCVMHLPPVSIRLRMGSTNGSSGGVVHIVSRITMHPDFNETTLINDVAVLRLRDRAVFSNKINISRIAGPRYVLNTNTVVTALGWGRLEYEGNRTDMLRQVAVNVINHKICTERYKELKDEVGPEDNLEVTYEMFCTGILDVGGKGTCQGDSGGPIMHRGDILVGIVSWAYECANDYFPSVNTRVSNYTQWIYSNSVN